MTHTCSEHSEQSSYFEKKEIWKMTKDNLSLSFLPSQKKCNQHTFKKGTYESNEAPWAMIR